MKAILMHHFYLLESAGGIQRAQEILKQQNFTPAAGENYFVFEYETFGINDARLLRNQALFRGEESRRVFIISVYAITQEGAQALLKILEEAPEGVTFFVCVPSLFQVPETILSRAYIVENEETKADESIYKIAEIFFEKPIKERYLAIEKLLKGVKDERPIRNRGLALLSALEKYAHEHKRSLPRNFFKNYFFMMQPTSSPKIILEAIGGEID